jgi:hypothetical protein
MKMDALGHTLWERAYGGPGLEQSFSIQQAPDRGYVIAGNTARVGPGWDHSDILLVKTEPDIAWQPQSVDLLVAPNPTSAGASIYYALPSAAAVRIAVYDIRGREITVLVGEDEYPGIHGVRWDGTDADGRRVRSGIYFCQFQAGSAVASGKVVLTR